MDWTFYNLLKDYEKGKINRQQFLTIYPDDSEWLNDVDADKDGE
jgi:lipopolysaccharide biosynthesis regulator YciM